MADMYPTAINRSSFYYETGNPATIL